MIHWVHEPPPPTLGSPVSSQSFIISANSIALWDMNSGLKLFTTAFNTIALEWNGNMGGYSRMEWELQLGNGTHTCKHSP